MKYLVISIPVDEEIKSCVRQIGLRMCTLNHDIAVAATENNPDLLFDAFAGIGNGEGEEYSFGLELTADEPVAGQRVGDSNARKLSEISLGYAPEEGFVNPLTLPKDSGIEISELEVMG
jgi:hypothetical protein